MTTITGIAQTGVSAVCTGPTAGNPVTATSVNVAFQSLENDVATLNNIMLLKTGGTLGACQLEGTIDGGENATISNVTILISELSGCSVRYGNIYSTNLLSGSSVTGGSEIGTCTLVGPLTATGSGEVRGAVLTGCSITGGTVDQAIECRPVRPVQIHPATISTASLAGGLVYWNVGTGSSADVTLPATAPTFSWLKIVFPAVSGCAGINVYDGTSVIATVGAVPSARTAEAWVECSYLGGGLGERGWTVFSYSSATECGVGPSNRPI